MQRRRLRLILFITLSALGVSVLLTHWGQGGDGDDWARFDRHRATVVSVSLDGSLGVQLAGEAGQTPVRLLGIAMPRAHRLLRRRPTPAGSWHCDPGGWAANSPSRLEPLQTRSADGELLAYLYISDTDNLNLDMVKDGYVYAERRSPYSLRCPFDQAESDARKKKRRGCGASRATSRCPSGESSG